MKFFNLRNNVVIGSALVAVGCAQVRGLSKTTRHVEVGIVVRALLIFVDVSVFIFGAVDETA